MKRKRFLFIGGIVALSLAAIVAAGVKFGGKFFDFDIDWSGLSRDLTELFEPQA